MSDRADENPEAWADRRPGGDGAGAGGTSGAPAGTSGVRMTAGAWALTVALLALVPSSTWRPFSMMRTGAACA